MLLVMLMWDLYLDGVNYTLTILKGYVELRRIAVPDS
jgi:hypothetical protein